MSTSNPNDISSNLFCKAGAELIWFGTVFRVHEVRGQNVVLERDGEKQRRIASLGALHIAYLVGQLEPRIGLSGGHQSISLRFRETVLGESEASQKRLIQLVDWMHELDANGLQRLNPKCPIQQLIVKGIQAGSKGELSVASIWTLYRAQKKVIDARGDLRAVLPQFRLRGRTTQKVTTEAGETVTVSKPRLHHVVRDHLLDLLAAHQADSTSKMLTQDINKQLEEKITMENATRSSLDQLKSPAQITISRWIARTTPAKDLSRHRLGAQRTAKLFRSSGVRVAAERILQFVQFDDIDARIFLIDEDTGLPWGTPNFTFGVDEHSQHVTGANYGPESRSVDTAISTVINSMRQKNMGDPEFALCKEPWTACGQFGLGIFDNASYNASLPFKLGMISMGLDYAFSKPKEPTGKSVVEHFNGQFKHQLVARLPGACVRKNDRDSLAGALKAAKFTLEEFHRLSMQWIVDEYSFKRGDDGLSPIERWRAQVSDVDLRVPRMDRPEFAEFTLPGSLKFRASGGLERNDLRYQSDRLDELRRRVGHNASVDIRVNPKCLEQLFVCDRQAEEWFTVPCAEDPAYVRGLTERQHQLVRSFAEKEKKQKVQSAANLCTVRDDLRAQALKDSTSKQLTVRRGAFLAKFAFRGLAMPTTKDPLTGDKPTVLLIGGAVGHTPPPSPAPAAPPKPTRLAYLAQLYEAVKS